MQTTLFQQLLDQLVAIAGSGRKAAPLVGVSQPSFSEWRRGIAYPDDTQAIKIAAVLELPAEYVLAAVRADRTESRDARRAWLRIAEQFRNAAAIACIAIGASVAGVPSDAQAASGNANYVKRRRFPNSMPVGLAA